MSDTAIIRFSALKIAEVIMRVAFCALICCKHLMQIKSIANIKFSTSRFRGIMGNYKVIKREGWYRKDHFEFYSKFDNSCFNLCVPVDAHKLYEFAKDKNESFFQLALYGILRSANYVPQLKQRVMSGNVIEYDSIDVMTPILTEQNGFRQVLCKNTDVFSDFRDQVSNKIQEVKNSSAGPLLIKDEGFFCASCLPWIHFSSITHAELTFSSAIPTLTWGKLKNGEVPVACKFSHALVDGFHAGQFYAHIEEAFQNPDSLCGDTIAC